MNVVVINGLKITTNCRYVKFTKSTKDSISESKVDDCFLVEYSGERLAKDINYRNVEVVNPCAIIQDTPYIKILNPVLSINGLVIRSLVSHEYQFSQFIVANLREFVMDYNEERCIILIPKTKETDVVSYEKLLLKNPYFELVDDTNLNTLTNIYGFQWYRDNLCINSNNDQVFNNKQYYTRYLLADIDVVQSFLAQVRTILKGYGMELHRAPIDETTRTVDRAIYKVTEYGKQESHKNGFMPLKDEIQHYSRIDFEATFLNNTMIDDFITRFQNCDLLSNFCQFYTKDKLGREWISWVKWDPITTDRTPDYSTDQQGNSAISCTFGCEIHYYVVYDRIYSSITEIITSITTESMFGGGEKTEVIETKTDPMKTDKNEIGDPLNVVEDKFETELEEWQRLRMKE